MIIRVENRGEALLWGVFGSKKNYLLKQTA